MVSRPDRAFRIADRRFPLFDGHGAFLHGGRWNSPGRRVIYAAASYAAALLEVLVHTRTGKVPRTHVWIEIEIPQHVSFEALDKLEGWDAPESTAARDFGDEWLRAGRSVVLAVPSLAASGLERNLLINPDHPDFSALSASEPREVIWDRRLFGN